MAFDLGDILRGDNSEAAFERLVRRFAASGVSGVVPKFLAPNTAGFLKDYNKATLPTDKYIIKGTTSRLPGVALNEHFCMQVAHRAFGHAARTEVSQDGQALAVHRFDYAEDGITRLGMEDLCSLLALRPEQKYESTWEKVANRIKDVTPVQNQGQALSDLGNLLLLTYALRNADCHTKNIALLYSGLSDVRLAPVYDMLTISVYDDYCDNPPGMSVGGRSTWRPGKALEVYLQTRCSLKPAEVGQRVERLCEAMVDVSTEVVRASRDYESFGLVGPRMLKAWNEGMNSLRLSKAWSFPSLEPVLQAEGFAEVVQPKAPARTKIGKSHLPLMS
nr:HipA domain-containing protein [Serpentinimonas maccroryi]